MKKISFLLVCVFLFVPLAAMAALNPQVENFTERTYAGWNQLVVCSDSSAVYYIGMDAKRYVFPNSKTFFTYYPDFSGVLSVRCEDLNQFPLAGIVTYNPGTRYVKFATENTVYAVEPGGVLRAIPNEYWMEVFVGTDWNEYIDDVSDAFYTSYKIGQPLALLEIPNGMTAKDPTTGIWYYFVDGQPKSLEGISFAFRDNGHFRNFTRTKDQASKFYERVEPALKNGTRIGSDYEIKLGTPWFWDNTSTWVDEDDFPKMFLNHDPDAAMFSLGDLPVSVTKIELGFGYDAETLQEMAQECNKDKGYDYYSALAEKFKDAKRFLYELTYTEPSQDGSVYRVTLIENAAHYDSFDDFKDDFDVCSAGGYAYPKHVTHDWLVFTSSCGSGFDDGSGFPHGCDLIKNQIESTLKPY